MRHLEAKIHSKIIGDGEFLKFSYVAIPLIITGETPDDILEVVERFDKEVQEVVSRYPNVINELSLSQCIACFAFNLENAEESTE